MSACSNQDLWVVVAAYNEARAIRGVVAAVRQAGFNILVVDDGSIDETGRIAQLAGAMVIQHPINLGQGAALQTGIDVALLAGAKFIVTFDADGQHRAGEIARLIDVLSTSRADFALGSRFLGRAVGIPPARRMLLRAATVFTRLTTGIDVSDAHNGFRAMSRRGAQSIRLRQNRMAHASELLEQIARSGRKYVEVPVTIDYSRYSKEKGQRSGDLLFILLDLFVGKLHR